MTEKEYFQIRNRFLNKLRPSNGYGTYHGRYDADFNEGIQAGVNVLDRDFQRSNVNSGRPMDDMQYRWLQDSLKKLIRNFPSNREETYNQAVLACKSILKAEFNSLKAGVRGEL